MMVIVHPQKGEGGEECVGRFVVAGLNRIQLDAFTNTKKGRKTEHIVGIVQNQEGDYTVFTNLLYHKERLGSVFTWRLRTIQPQPQGLAVNQSNMSSRSMLETFSKKLFPDKTKNLSGAGLNVGTFNFPPAVIYQRGKNGGEGHWYGDNILLAETVADVLNFSLRYKRPPAGEVLYSSFL
ncbi:hypothetical protein O3P69_008848 [Scylla paramamosain]|uniref:Uncharacterized protein n=1 Tax=Scylla paramamosain TaxID=85552 RepID=A0AAW0TQ17_SCYPA